MAILGSTGYVEIAPTLETSVERGRTTVRRFRGTYAALLAATAGIGGLSQRLEQEDDIWWLLSATFAGWPDSTSPNPLYPDLESQVVHLWSLEASRLAKSVWTHPRVDAEFSKLKDWAESQGRPEIVGQFRSDILALAQGQSVTEDVVDESKEHGDPARTTTLRITFRGLMEEFASVLNRDVIQPLFETLCAGVEHFVVDAFVLQRRSVAPNGSRLAPAYENTNRLYRTESMISFETIPETLRQNLPPGYWLKGAPRVTQTDANRFEVVQEWTHSDTASVFLYGEPI